MKQSQLREELHVAYAVVDCPRGGHSHRRHSHGCDRGQEAVKGSRAVFGVGQAVKDNFKLGNSGQDINVLRACILHIV